MFNGTFSIEEKATMMPKMKNPLKYFLEDFSQLIMLLIF